MARPGMSIIGLVLAWNLFHRLFEPAYRAAVDLVYSGAL